MRYEIDFKNRIVDIFVQRDENCPFPFLNGDASEAHEGLTFEQFSELVNQILCDIGDEMDASRHSTIYDSWCYSCKHCVTDPTLVSLKKREEWETLKKHHDHVIWCSRGGFRFAEDNMWTIEKIACFGWTPRRIKND